MAKNRYNWFDTLYNSVNCTCDILNKDESTRNYVSFMLNRTNQMFEYNGLPDTIPAYMLETYLQMDGQCCITEVSGNLYALNGNLGGAPDPYYRPTLYVVANPALGEKLKKNLRILNHLPPYGKQDYGGECVLVRNDTRMEGLYYMYSRYATQLSENDVSIRCAQINTRMNALIKASTDKDTASAEAYIRAVEEGRLAIVASKPFIEESLTAANVSPQITNQIMQLIELQQYLKASWFNDLGLHSNYNMKREYVSKEELSSSSDTFLPLIDDMLRCREEALDLVNKTYGTNITVQKNSAWENQQKEIELSMQEKENDAGGNDGVSNN